MSDRFGNYELLEKIAVGGMAEIFRARSIHGQGVQKNIVIKRIHPTLSTDKSFVAMFIDEARLGVSMVHGNIVPVFDFGCVDGFHYLAMEYVAGQNLASLGARVIMVDLKWPLDLAIYVVTEVLEGLEYAHRKRDDQGRPLELVHRDVSPSNVLLSDDGQVKLLDFGIARSEAREYETRTGVIKGKPGYMSPEQAAGKAVDARADVWSCGSVLHELVTGQRLKDGRKQCDDSALETVLNKALAADPSQRFQTAREFQTALADILAERNLRPNSSDLSEFINQVNTSHAPGENWDMQSTAVEKHVAEALAHQNAPDSPPSKTTVPSGTRQTQRIDPESDSKTKRRPWIIASLALIAALAVGVMLVLPDNDESPLSLETGDTAEPVNPVGTNRNTPSESALGKSSLSVVSKPPGARILIDGQASGETTPAHIRVSPGKHLVELALAGHNRWSRSTEINPGEQLDIEAKLVLLPAKIQVSTLPESALVYIDGKKRGKSPITLIDLAPGNHDIVAKIPGRPDAVQNVTVASGENKKIELVFHNRNLKKIKTPTEPAVLSINSEPWSHVTLDGKPFGTTPILNRSIPPGRHTVVLTNPVRNLSSKVAFSVKPGQQKRIREILR